MHCEIMVWILVLAEKTQFMRVGGAAQVEKEKSQDSCVYNFECVIAYCVRSWSPRGKRGLGNERKEQVMCCSEYRKGGKRVKVLRVNGRWRGGIWKENVFISGKKCV